MKKILPALIIIILCFFISSCSREEKQGEYRYKVNRFTGKIEEIWSPRYGEWISMNEYRELERTQAQMRTQRWEEQSRRLQEKSQEQIRIMDQQRRSLKEDYPEPITQEFDWGDRQSLPSDEASKKIKMPNKWIEPPKGIGDGDRIRR